MQSGVVEPVDPFQRRELDVGERLPGAFAADLLGLEQADRGLGQGVVVGVADAAHGRVDAGVDEPLGEGETDVLAAVVVSDESSPAPAGRPARSRVQSAISSVSSTSPVRMLVSAFQPTIRRLNTSMTNAT